MVAFIFKNTENIVDQVIFPLSNIKFFKFLKIINKRCYTLNKHKENECLLERNLSHL